VTRFTRARAAAAIAVAALALAASPATWADSSAPSGLDGLMPPPPGIQQGNTPTLEERYPVVAYANFNVDALSTIGSGFQDPTGTAANVLANWWASQLMVLVAAVGMLTIRLVEWTFGFDLAAGAGGPLSAVVGALHDHVYVPLLPVALALLAIGLTWQLLVRRRTMQGLQGAGWAVAALAAAAVYFAAPAQVLGAVDGFTGDLSRALLASIGAADPGLATRSGNPSFSQGDPADAELRMFADRYWRTFVFEPWSVASLGDPVSGQRYGEELLAKQSNLPSNFDADFGGASDQAKAWYSGRYGGYRLILVVLALVAVLIASVLCVVVAGTVLMAQLALLLLLMVAPLILLVGVHPGVGRRILVRLLELAAGALLIRGAVGGLPGGAAGPERHARPVRHGGGGRLAARLRPPGGAAGRGLRLPQAVPAGVRAGGLPAPGAADGRPRRDRPGCPLGSRPRRPARPAAGAEAGAQAGCQGWSGSCGQGRGPRRRRGSQRRGRRDEGQPRRRGAARAGGGQARRPVGGAGQAGDAGRRRPARGRRLGYAGTAQLPGRLPPAAAAPRADGAAPAIGPDQGGPEAGDAGAAAAAGAGPDVRPPHHRRDHHGDHEAHRPSGRVARGAAMTRWQVWLAGVAATALAAAILLASTPAGWRVDEVAL
jgi:hypothetical protein